jgi:hypothetical protein
LDFGVQSFFTARILAGNCGKEKKVSLVLSVLIIWE